MRVKWNGDTTSATSTDQSGVHFPKGEYVTVPENQRSAFASNGAFTIEPTPGNPNTSIPERQRGEGYMGPNSTGSSA